MPEHANQEFLEVVVVDPHSCDDRFSHFSVDVVQQPPHFFDFLLIVIGVGSEFDQFVPE